MNNVSFTITTKLNNTSVLTYKGLTARSMFINFYCGVKGTVSPSSTMLDTASKIFDILRDGNGIYVDPDGNSYMMLDLDQDK